jgi:CubicO group peptidase (beta-lactamase class C family)
MNRCVQWTSIVLFSAALTGLRSSARSEPLAADPALTAAIDKLVAKNGISADTPGVAIAVQQPGRVQFAKGYGLARLRDKAPITPQTNFELASTSKLLTATAVLLFHDRGDLSLNDDVRKHIPQLPIYDKQHPIHIRDLLQHVSGFPQKQDYMSFEGVAARHKTYWVNEDYAAAFAKRQNSNPLAFPPGEKYEYSNTNYMLLALVLERVAKKSFGTLMRDEVFKPIGMRNSFVYENPRSVPKHPTLGLNNAIAYGKAMKEWEEGWGCPPYRNEALLTTGDGGIWSSLEDMAAFDDAVRKSLLLKPETWKEALTPSKTRDGQSNHCGCGWHLYFDGAKLIGYGHDGSWAGFRTSYYRYLIADRTTIVLSNRLDFDVDKFWYALNDVIESHLASSPRRAPK